MMKLLYGKKVLGVQLFVTCSLLLLAALRWRERRLATSHPSLTACMLTPSMPMPGMAWFFAAPAFRQPSDFVFRFGSFSQTFIDGPAIFDPVREVGPHAPDASYCRMS